ncbi:three-Cys-motif partner protein TcmP, partial [Sphingobium xanthum]|uniref:three-Cys-motif partner protein TcmP n=1 Tax=Sphingobium xanthum TaxID=1387165 RepID=UPI003D2033EE
MDDPDLLKRKREPQVRRLQLAMFLICTRSALRCQGGFPKEQCQNIFIGACSFFKYDRILLLEGITLTPKKRVAHRFGGIWTEIKLKALTEYLHFYQNALKNQGFETWYIDAFAGTGDRHAEMQLGDMFEDSPIEQVEIILDGSARKALKIDPPFSHYWFTEQHQGRAKVLRSLITEFDRKITVQTGEANAALNMLFTSPPWRGGLNAGRQRGVVFLDPYGMSVDWSTLEILAQTKRVDVWHLFPRKAVVQQLAHNIKGVDQAKRAKLSQIFGTESWEEELYEIRPQSLQTSMFDLLSTQEEETKDRIATPKQIRVRTHYSHQMTAAAMQMAPMKFLRLRSKRVA